MSPQPPADIKWTTPWQRLTDAGEAFVNELRKELSPQQVLSGVPLVAVARRVDCDDVLFVTEMPSMPLAVVHLTWTGKAESDPRWPGTSAYRSWQDFIERCLNPESQTFALVGFHAQHVVVTDEESYLLIGFADDHNDTDEHLMFQRAHEYDEQDFQLGMNDVYIEYMDQSRSAYGGIARIELHRD